jgi:hypothetical protein
MSTAASPRERKTPGCPLCARPPSGVHGPFCGQGCRDRDLLNWLGDGYRVPGAPAAENEEGGLDSER